MVGEVRDAETAKIAVRAALTGHLILTTMHTRDAQGAIFRLLEFGVSLLEVEQTLIGVTAQRLVELRCLLCKGDCALACKMTARNKRASVYELLDGKSLAEVLRIMGDEKGKATVSYRQLKDEIGKAVAMGYVESQEYERLVYHETKK